MQYTPLAPGIVHLLPGDLMHRYLLNRSYVLSLENDCLLFNFYNEAGMHANTLPAGTLPEHIHKGWEAPNCQLRGHFPGHLLSACAWAYAYMGDLELKGKADQIVEELRHCQIENGNGWVFSIPEKYLEWVARGKRVWAPQYTVHKTLMGLMDMYVYAGNQQALTVMKEAAEWFYRWSGRFTREQFDDILDTETGGMLEFFADLYGITGEEHHRILIERYYRGRVFDQLLAGVDVLTNMHANTTIPEALGCARAYEVTGEQKYMDAVKAYWDAAVTRRGTFVTGGQTCYEIWTAPNRFDDRLNEDNQEHCTVYNLIRLAEFLFKHTGDVSLHDYIERNFVNGILAQQHNDTGMVAYYLPMQPGAHVKWGNKEENFWCCHGTLVQVHMRHPEGTVYKTETGLAIMQYRPMKLTAEGMTLRVTEAPDVPDSGRRPDPAQIADCAEPFHGRRYRISVKSEEAENKTLTLRIPWWVWGEATIYRNKQAVCTAKPASVVTLQGPWHDDIVQIDMPGTITCHALPDAPERFAFMDGPDVLVGLTEDDAMIVSGDPASVVARENRRSTLSPEAYYRTKGLKPNFRLIPLRNLRDETYTMYFRKTSR